MIIRGSRVCPFPVSVTPARDSKDRVIDVGASWLQKLDIGKSQGGVSYTSQWER